MDSLRFSSCLLAVPPQTLLALRSCACLLARTPRLYLLDCYFTYTAPLLLLSHFSWSTSSSEMSLKSWRWSSDDFSCGLLVCICLVERWSQCLLSSCSSHCETQGLSLLVPCQCWSQRFWVNMVWEVSNCDYLWTGDVLLNCACLCCVKSAQKSFNSCVKTKPKCVCMHRHGYPHENRYSKL